MNKVQFTKVGVNYTHTSGVTIVKPNAFNNGRVVLVPGKAPEKFGSFNSAKAYATAQITALAA